MDNSVEYNYTIERMQARLNGAIETVNHFLEEVTEDRSPQNHAFKFESVHGIMVAAQAKKIYSDMFKLIKNKEEQGLKDMDLIKAVNKYAIRQLSGAAQYRNSGGSTEPTKNIARDIKIGIWGEIVEITNGSI